MFKKTAIALTMASVFAATSVMAATTDAPKVAPKDAPKAAPQAIAPTIAVINLPLIMSEIPQTKSSQQALAKEFEGRENELKKLQDEGQKLAADLNSGKITGDKATEAQRKLAQLHSDFKLKATALEEDSRARLSQEQVKITTEVQKAIDKIAKERGIQLVLREGAIAYTINALDISQDVIDMVSKAKK